MFDRLFRMVVAMLCLSLAACAATPPGSAGYGPNAVVIAGADVLTMTEEGALRDRTVVVEGDRIVAIRPFSDRDLALANAIDGRGKVVMPGLVDMHVHFANAPGAPGDASQRAAAVMLAHGVTTARSMAGAPTHIALRAALESGTLAGPRIYAASPPISDATVKSAEQAVALVGQAKSAGFDLVKSHVITDTAVWKAAHDEAARLAIPTAGHVTNAVGLERAMAAKQQIEHLDGFAQALLSPGAPERGIEFGQIPPPPVMAKIDRAAIPDAAIFDLAAREKSWHVPTIGLFELLMDTKATAAELRALPEMQYVPDEALEQWAQQHEQRRAQLPADYAADVVAYRRAVVKALDAHGVRMMAGSDTAQAFHIWGPALHREIEALARVLGPEKALRATTVNPRDYLRSLPANGSALGWKADFGTVEAGARADLVMLDGDPRSDLSVLHRPAAVMKAGKLYDRAALDALLAGAAASAKDKSVGASPAAAAASLPPVWIMRHLEPEESGDRHLTAAGRAMAEALAGKLAGEKIGAIYVTDTARARETAGPLAKRLGLTPIVYNPSRPDLLMQQVVGGKVPALIVGHSNTAPDLAKALGADPAGAQSLVNFGTIFHRNGPAAKFEALPGARPVAALRLQPRPAGRAPAGLERMRAAA